MKKYIISSILIVLAGYIMWSLLQVRTAELTRVLPMAPQEEKHAVSVPAANQVAEMRSAPTVPIVTDTHVYLTFVTPGREYNAPVAEGGEVLYGIMKALSETSDFTFTGKDFSSLGFFVDTINGQKMPMENIGFCM